MLGKDNIVLPEKKKKKKIISSKGVSRNSNEADIALLSLMVQMVG